MEYQRLLLRRHCVERVLLCNIQSVVWDDRNLLLYHGGGHRHHQVPAELSQ